MPRHDQHDTCVPVFTASRQGNNKKDATAVQRQHHTLSISVEQVCFLGAHGLQEREIAEEVSQNVRVPLSGFQKVQSVLL